MFARGAESLLLLIALITVGNFLRVGRAVAKERFKRQPPGFPANLPDQPASYPIPSNFQSIFGPTPGEFSNWSGWSTCSTAGQQQRVRSCSTNFCVGPYNEIQPCLAPPPSRPPGIAQLCWFGFRYSYTFNMCVPNNYPY